MYLLLTATSAAASAAGEKESIAGLHLQSHNGDEEEQGEQFELHFNLRKFNKREFLIGKQTAIEPQNDGEFAHETPRLNIPHRTGAEIPESPSLPSLFFFSDNDLFYQNQLA